MTSKFVLSRLLFFATLFLAGAAAADAQTGVTAYPAKGQIWVRWTDDTSPSPGRQALPAADTYVVYVSNSPTGPWQETGRVYPADFTGQRFKDAAAGAGFARCDGQTIASFTWRVPHPTTGQPTALAADQALFVYTPHDALRKYFSVAVETAAPPNVGEAQGATPDPTVPVTAHYQLCVTRSVTGYTAVGEVYAHWIDGRADWTVGRTDYPVMGTASANGVASLFAVWRNGTETQADLPLLFFLHGIDGDFLKVSPATWTPNRLAQGLVCTVDDSLWIEGNATGPESTSTLWLGYWDQFNRFTPPASVPPGSLVVPYTMRRVDWLRGWMLANLQIGQTLVDFDGERVAVSGFSAGAIGAGAQVRFKPENWSAATLFKPPVSGDGETPACGCRGADASASVDERLIGSDENYLALACAQLAPPTSRPPCSPKIREFLRLHRVASRVDAPFFQVLWGVCDCVSPFECDPKAGEYCPSAQIAALDDDVNADDGIPNQSLGAATFWHEEKHAGACETTSSPCCAPQCPTASTAHWLAYSHLKGDYLVRFRRSESFPGFFSEGPAPATAFGTRGGYLTWSAVSESASGWSASVSVEAVNPDGVTSVATRFTVRRARTFRPRPGAQLRVQLGAQAPQFVTVAADGTWSVPLTITTSAQTLAVTYQQASTLEPGDAIGVYQALQNPATNGVHLKNQNSPGVADWTFTYGGAGWVLVAGNWDCDAVDTIGAYDPATGAFYLKNANAGGSADATFVYGAPGATPIAGDWNGDGVDTVGIYVGSAGAFHLRDYNFGGVASTSFVYGPAGAGWKPIVGDWNGDGTDTIGLYDPVNGVFFLRNSNIGGVADVAFAYGAPGLVPLAGDWNGDGTDTIGLYDPATGAFFLRNTNTPGVADVTFIYGPAGFVPLVGNWDGR
jgi:hypothetical protein